MSAPIQLPEPCRQDLLKLYQQQESAKATYNLAASMALKALGLDPALPNTMDLDTGLISPAPTPEQE